MPNRNRLKELNEESLRMHEELMKQYEEEFKQLNKSYYSPMLYNYIEFDEISDTGLGAMELIEDLQEDIKNKNNISEDIDCLIESLTKWKSELKTQLNDKLKDDPELAYLVAKWHFERPKLYTVDYFESIAKKIIN